MPKKLNLTYFDPAAWNTLMAEAVKDRRGKHERKPGMGKRKPAPPPSLSPAEKQRLKRKQWAEAARKRAAKAAAEMMLAAAAQRRERNAERRARARLAPLWQSVLLAMQPGEWHTTPALAAAIGVSSTTVSRVLRRDLWIRRPHLVERRSIAAVTDGWSASMLYRLTDKGAELRAAIL